MRTILIKRVLHNRFLLNRSILTLVWGLYVTSHLYSFGWEIPREKVNFILWNNTSLGLNVAFILVGIFGILVTTTKHNDVLFKLIALIGIVVLWSCLSYIFILKDFVILHKITFSTILILSVPISTLIEILVGDSL